MGIRIAERASISKEFKDAVLMIARERLVQISEEIETKSGEPIQAKMFKQKIAPKVVRLGKLVQDPETGMDMILTRLRGLPYTSFEVMSYDNAHPDVCFLTGTTRPVEIRYGSKIYDLGPFSVRIPFSMIIGTNYRAGTRSGTERQAGEKWHFIPLLKPGAERDYNDYRHPHHYGRWPTSSNTCWGSFGPMVINLVQQSDIPEIFRTIYIYLSRNDNSSVLHGHLKDNFEWAKIRQAGAGQ